jgi:Fe-S-cluster containining protein
MKSATSSESCSRCRGCCRFEKEDAYATILARPELDKIREKLGSIPKVKEFKGSGKVFQVQLIKSAKGDCYICPFLDEEKSSCRIYELRPLECRIWPFMLARSRDGKSVNLVCLEKRDCPSYEKVSPQEFEGHKRPVLRMVKSGEIIGFIRKFPELIWDHEPYSFFVEEIKELKKC